MEKEIKNKKQGCLLGFIIFSILAIIISLLYPVNEPIKTEDTFIKEWKDMTYSERELWINKYMDNPDDNGYALIGYAIDGIKQRIQYPKTVRFDISPSFNKHYRNVVEVDSGWVFSYGNGTAKNAYGVPIEFKYSVKWKITTDELKILEISVY